MTVMLSNGLHAAEHLKSDVCKRSNGKNKSELGDLTER